MNMDLHANMSLYMHIYRYTSEIMCLVFVTEGDLLQQELRHLRRITLKSNQ